MLRWTLCCCVNFGNWHQLTGECVTVLRGICGRTRGVDYHRGDFVFSPVLFCRLSRLSLKLPKKCIQFILTSVLVRHSSLTSVHFGFLPIQSLHSDSIWSLPQIMVWDQLHVHGETPRAVLVLCACIGLCFGLRRGLYRSFRSCREIFSPEIKADVGDSGKVSCGRPVLKRVKGAFAARGQRFAGPKWPNSAQCKADHSRWIGELILFFGKKKYCKDRQRVFQASGCSPHMYFAECASSPCSWCCYVEPFDVWISWFMPTNICAEQHGPCVRLFLEDSSSYLALTCFAWKYPKSTKFHHTNFQLLIYNVDC